VLSAIPRYGARVVPNTIQIIETLQRRGGLIEGPEIREFERAFAERVGARHAITTSYGRMAFWYLLNALDLPEGSEIILPALTFWVVPELARAAGLTPVFADVDPRYFTLDPASFERAITPRTSAVVPTHLYGLPCDMRCILAIARRHRLKVIEDCAHALGATWDGRPVGALGDGGFFSFQLLKPLNTYGGGIAVTNDDKVAARLREQASLERLPTEAEILKQLWIGRVQRIAIRPRVFSASLFPVMWGASWINANPDVYLWEKIRPLTPIPDEYRRRYTNVQAALGLAGLEHLDRWTTETIEHAQELGDALSGNGVQTPSVPERARHVFYQYAMYADDRDAVVRRCLRRGVDVESLHVDVCTTLPLFGNGHAPVPGAERAAEAIQLPVYASLRPEHVGRIAAVVREAVGA
jgi:dTDP-4-amino-4,6-dideoxygalactose transaminase